VLFSCCALLRRLTSRRFQDRNELVSLLKAALQGLTLDLSSEQIDIICEKTMKQCDCDGSGTITYEGYRLLIEQSPRLLDCFNVDIEGILQSRRKTFARSRCWRMMLCPPTHSNRQASRELTRSVAVPWFAPRSLIRQMKTATYCTS
jgi:hypothetical protein